MRARSDETLSVGAEVAIRSRFENEMTTGDWAGTSGLRRSRSIAAASGSRRITIVVSN
jgi:hypothetical protein